ncbi:1-acyl-sn-glycerol-3-phosphate acyltransferase [Gloeocapsopsis crepidinum LEGE 06123]|uniref:1-acyl-sn-glycerol-3-phosphate acyltransferase n=1 Tax=Gloeocapsopsis crepidinum LEGE 06123 TaxID=588587 RepID=A0ABR9UYQ9_9CHRO|nr:1-acyl-sn-glycerol-3-phosphate acyltransferase [Gloeocapsopsis crepidinum]MBE9193455.1 1-acyl-sn-glycerol-3-phosphate acyltransferase [Gloeocapsopsis crepidinum LEGE 06123]
MNCYNFTWFDWFCLWYPPGWLILFNRHWQHYHADPDGWNWLEYILFLIPCGFYLALFIRWLRLGCRFPRIQSYTFDPYYQQAFRDEILSPIVKFYFRAELKQLENLPKKAPLLVAMNHAGMCFPWDFLVLGYLLSETRNWTVQPLAGVALFDHPWMRWWLPSGWAQVLGGVRAKRDDFEAALAQETVLLYAPEGLRGPMKGWSKKHQLETFDSSFIQLSDRYNIPILPVVCLGNEYLHPWAIHFKALAKKLYLPFLPISPLIPLFALFPSMGVWAMRSRLCYFIQPVYKTELKADGNMRMRSRAYQEAQSLREKMQTLINQLLQ